MVCGGAPGERPEGARTDGTREPAAADGGRGEAGEG